MKIDFTATDRFEPHWFQHKAIAYNRQLLLCLSIILLGFGVSLIQGLTHAGQLSLFIFGITAITWTFTNLNVSYVAVVAALALVITGVVPQKQMFETLGDQIIWLTISAFILGAAVKQTGLAARLTQFILSRLSTVESLFWLMTVLIIPLSFLIPSTSGRAAVTLPIYRSITSELDRHLDEGKSRQIARALALLIPTIILVSTIVSLVGAGSHLVANELLHQMTQQQLSFGQWAIYGLPFGIAASLLSCGAIVRMYLDRSTRRQNIVCPPDIAAKNLAWTRSESFTLAVALGMLTLWLTESWHGLDLATVGLLGSLLLTAPRFGVLTWKKGLTAVSWHLIMFVSAALVLGKSLVDSGAAKWIIDTTLRFSGIGNHNSQIAILVILTVIALTSHIYITSHTARAVILVPPLISLAIALEIDPVAVMFIGTLGMDYCLTMPVSSKALLVYQDGDFETFSPADLLKLSLVLMPLHLGLTAIFYFTYWHWVGLSF